VTDAWIVKRRPRRVSPLRRHRFVEAAVTAGHSTVAFPGSAMPEPAGARERVVSSGASILLHGALLLALVLVARLAPEELVEQFIEVQRLEEPANEPAPRPRAIAESRARFDPAPMALAPQIVNPTVIQQRVPDLQAKPIQVAEIAPVLAPREIAPIAAPQVEAVQAFQSPVSATTAAVKIDTKAPSLSGPVEFQAPVGTLAGPRQVVGSGNTVGIADPTALGTGSSVREGIDSNRDVHGAKTGERASVNVAVGPGGGRGTGGDGTGPGGGVSFEECMARPEVQAYLERLKNRVDSRWRGMPTLPDGTFKVTLGFRLDPSGSANDVALVASANSAIGQSAAEAMRAASPFDQMPDRVRCIAGNRFNLIFTLDLGAAN